MKVWLALAVIVSCGPAENERGSVGTYCKHDGTCINDRLECVDSPVFLGIPVEAKPRCRMKKAQ